MTIGKTTRDIFHDALSMLIFLRGRVIFSSSFDSVYVFFFFFDKRFKMTIYICLKLIVYMSNMQTPLDVFNKLLIMCWRGSLIVICK